jgi:hypothetical protein
MDMSIQDIWLARFRAAVDMEIQDVGGKAADGYRGVALKTGLGYDYIYQIYKGKPANKPKVPSADAMNTIERVYGGRLGDAPATHQNRPPEPVAPQTMDQMLETITQMAKQIKELQQRADQSSSVTQIEHAWPFQSITREQWSILKDAQREHVEAGIRMLLGATPVSGSGSGTEKRHAA